MEPKINRYIFLFCFFLFCLTVGDTSGIALQTKLIRVAILKDTREFTLSIKGRYRIVDISSGQIISNGKTSRDSKVIVRDTGITVDSQNYLTPHIKITPERDATIYINGRRFRGEMDVIRDSQGYLSVVNTVALEDYVKGVMYHEVSHYWPMESLKAQAVAARTYALYQMKMNQSKEYDVTNDIYSQVYGGRSSEKYRTSIAVERTEGLVMTYRGNILPAYFHATCGGATEDAKELWKQDLPPLKGVRCDFCKNSPHYSWKKNFRLTDIQGKLNQKGYAIGLIKDIAVMERDQSERIRTLKVTTRDDKKIIISGKDFRDIIGPNLIRSNNYAIEMKGYYVDLIGKGWGHGVGMCQWGAAEMSHEDYAYDQILKYYYPGVEIINNESF